MKGSHLTAGGRRGDDGSKLLLFAAFLSSEFITGDELNNMTGAGNCQIPVVALGALFLFPQYPVYSL